MNGKNEVSLLFRFLQSATQEKSRYKIVLFFDQNGHIPLENIRKINGDQGLEFETKEDLVAFAEKFNDTFNYNKAFLLAANDFNIGLESCHNIEKFQTIFQEYGNCIESQAKPEQSLFSKIF